MKKIIAATFVASLILAALPAWPADLLPREHVMNFRGTLIDESGMPFDGTASMEMTYYSAPSRDAGPPLYRESFLNVVVRHGIFNLPLLKGTIVAGGPGAVTSGMAAGRYVDVAVNGELVLELQPLGTQFAAIRAEKADVAYGLKEDMRLTLADIPAHPANKVTSGVLGSARMPTNGVSAASFSNGVLRYDQIPAITADKIGAGTFPDTLIPDTLDASLFTTGIMSADILPSDILLRENIYVSSGTAGHLGVIPIPPGFTRNQCQWIVGLYHLDGFGGVDQFRVNTDQNGVVTCRWSPDEADAELNNYCTVSYLLVCLK